MYWLMIASALSGLIRLEHAVLVEQRQARGGHAHHHVGLRVALLGQQLGGDDAGGVAHPFDLDVGLDLVEAFLVGLDLVGLERRVDEQRGLLCETQRRSGRGLRWRPAGAMPGMRMGLSSNVWRCATKQVTGLRLPCKA